MSRLTRSWQDSTHQGSSREMVMTQRPVARASRQWCWLRWPLSKWETLLTSDRSGWAQTRTVCLCKPVGRSSISVWEEDSNTLMTLQKIQLMWRRSLLTHPSLTSLSTRMGIMPSCNRLVSLLTLYRSIRRETHLMDCATLWLRIFN